jgi:hypothetical protein
MKFLFVTVFILLILWSIYGYFGSRVEQAEYSVIKRVDGYEIRNYPAHIVAQTTVDGSYQESMSTGFRIVARYIFGGNIKKESVAMTAPVVMQENASEKIAMTAPVLVRDDGGSRIISFGMPKSYTLETLPTPTDSRVKLVEVPDKKFAVMKFFGYRTNVRIQETEKKLLGMLSKDGIEVISKPSYAGYNAPGTPPWMMRNEVMVEIR